MTVTSLFSASIIAALLGFACSSPPSVSDRVDPLRPDPAAFKPVALAVVHRCGSLDCHGSTYRNMRLFGYGSARLDANQRPDLPITTGDDEVLADYDAVVGVEPEVFSHVIADKGAGADRLTFYRKGRGLEHHKAGTKINAGDNADKCILSWLAGSVDVASCNLATAEP